MQIPHLQQSGNPSGAPALPAAFSESLAALQIIYKRFEPYFKGKYDSSGLVLRLVPLYGLTRHSRLSHLPNMLRPDPCRFARIAPTVAHLLPRNPDSRLGLLLSYHSIIRTRSIWIYRIRATLCTGISSPCRLVGLRCPSPSPPLSNLPTPFWCRNRSNRCLGPCIVYIPQRTAYYIRPGHKGYFASKVCRRFCS